MSWQLRPSKWKINVCRTSIKELHGAIAEHGEVKINVVVVALLHDELKNAAHDARRALDRGRQIHQDVADGCKLRMNLSAIEIDLLEWFDC